jgi:hypothetical protein
MSLNCKNSKLKFEDVPLYEDEVVLTASTGFIFCELKNLSKILCKNGLLLKGLIQMFIALQKS